MKPINITTSRDAGDDHPNHIEEFWEITECFGLARTRIKNGATVVYEGNFFIGNFPTLDEALEMVKSNGRQIIDSNMGEPIIVSFTKSTTPHWSPNRDMNDVFVTVIEKHLNMQLRRRGHVFLNEVFDQLGLPRTRTGVITGWLCPDDEFVSIRRSFPNDTPDMVLEIAAGRPIHNLI